MSDEEFSTWIDAFNSARLFKEEKYDGLDLVSSEIYLPKAYSCIKADRFMEGGHEIVVFERSPFLEYPLLQNNSKQNSFRQLQSIDINDQVLFKKCETLPIMHLEFPERTKNHFFSFNQPAKIEGALSMLVTPIWSDYLACNRYSLKEEQLDLTKFPEKYENLEFELKERVDCSLELLEFPCCPGVEKLHEKRMIDCLYKLNQNMRWRFKVQHNDYSCLVFHENLELPLVKDTLVTDIRPLWIQYFNELELSLEIKDFIIAKEQNEWTWPLKKIANRYEKDFVLNVEASSDIPNTESEISTSNPINYQGRQIVLNYGMLNEHQIIKSFQRNGLCLIERDFGTPMYRMFAVSDQDLFILYRTEMNIDELNLRKMKSKYSKIILLINIKDDQFGKAAISSICKLSFAYNLKIKYYQSLPKLLEIIACAMSTDQIDHFEDDESMHERLLVRALPNMNPHKAQKLLRKYSLRDVLTGEYQPT